METIHDAYHVFDSKPALEFVKPLIDAAPIAVRAHTFFDTGKVNEYNWPMQERRLLPAYSIYNINKFSKYLTRTTGQMYVKMLNVIDKHGDASYHDIYNQVLKPLGKPFGNDALSFRGIADNGLMELDHFGKYKRKFYRCTSLGKIVLENAKKNDVAYKVLRHFMKFKDAFDDAQMISIQMNPETTMLDITPESFAKMLDAILNPASVLHQIGSYAHWLNKLIECTKKSSIFCDELNCDEVKAYITSNMSNIYVKRFNDVFQKIMKKHAKMLHSLMTTA